MDLVVAQQILDDIDRLIAAKLSGATSIAELASRSLGSRSVDIPGSLRELRELREYYARQIIAGNFVGREDHFVIES